MDSTLLAVSHPGRVAQSAGFDGAGWSKRGSFVVRGVKPRLLRSTNRAPLSYELTAANAADALLADALLARGLLAGAGLEEDGVAGRLFGDLAYRSGALGGELAEAGVPLVTERADRRTSIRQRVEVCFTSLKRTFGMGEPPAKTLVGLVTRIAAKAAAYTYGLYVNRFLGRPRGRVKEPWA